MGQFDSPIIDVLVWVGLGLLLGRLLLGWP
jgi:hypothetical protein